MSKDIPVSFRWNADVKSLSFVGGAEADETVRAILLHAFVVGQNDPSRWISYSRRKCWYTPRRRYNGRHTYMSVTRAVDLLSSEGWIEHRKAKPSSHSGLQSSFRASAKLIDELIGTQVALAPSYEPIVLRKKEGEVVPYEDSPSIRKMRNNLIRINEALSSACLAHPVLGVINPGNPTRFEFADNGSGELKWTQSGPADMTLFRVFTGDFSLHGRFYGGFWQQWPEQERTQLTIDGGRVVEEDYASIHPRLLYLERGLVPPRDPYDIPGIRREVAKIALLVMINASTRRAALMSLKRRPWELDVNPTSAEIDATVGAIEKHHRLIADAFHSDSGIRLMWHDARMAERVMLHLLDQNIIALPIHDSFVVRAEFRQNLVEAMELALKTTLQVTTREKRDTIKAQRDRKEDRERTQRGHMWNPKRYVEPIQVKPLNQQDKIGATKVSATKAA